MLKIATYALNSKKHQTPPSTIPDNVPARSVQRQVVFVGDDETTVANRPNPAINNSGTHSVGVSTEMSAATLETNASESIKNPTTPVNASSSRATVSTTLSVMPTSPNACQ